LCGVEDCVQRNINVVPNLAFDLGQNQPCNDDGKNYQDQGRNPD